MMKKTITMLALGLALGTTAAVAEPVTGTEPVLCGIFEVHECVAEDGCEQVRPQDINIRTRFLTVDFRKREIRAKGTERKTTVDEVREVGNKLVLAGAESGEATGEAGIGYSLTITKDTGRMAMSITGDDVTFTVFGSCTAM